MRVFVIIVTLLIFAACSGGGERQLELGDRTVSESQVRAELRVLFLEEPAAYRELCSNIKGLSGKEVMETFAAAWEENLASDDFVRAGQLVQEECSRFLNR